MKLAEIRARWRFWKSADRIGPDIPSSHWRLHFKSTMLALCTSKFKHFGVAAEWRPGAYAVACSKISLGNRVIIRPGSMLFADPRDGGAEIVIEDNVMLGSGVQIYVHNHRFDAADIPIIDQGHYPSESVTLKRGCWIGANTIILSGVTVGENAVVGAGSVVTRNIAARMLAAGNPAKVIREIGERRESAAVGE
jgi:acetyltransferase-like isoleucine patch superfamily enzyme